MPVHFFCSRTCQIIQHTCTLPKYICISYPHEKHFFFQIWGWRWGKVLTCTSSWMWFRHSQYSPWLYPNHSICLQLRQHSVQALCFLLLSFLFCVSKADQLTYQQFSHYTANNISQQKAIELLSTISAHGKPVFFLCIQLSKRLFHKSCKQVNWCTKGENPERNHYKVHGHVLHVLELQA